MIYCYYCGLAMVNGSCLHMNVDELMRSGGPRLEEALAASASMWQERLGAAPAQRKKG